MSRRPRTIQIFLPSGDPSGVRKAEITTSIIRVIEVPRSLAADFCAMDESLQMGVYFLIGGERDDVLYVGQSSQLGSRLTNHHKEGTKDWDKALIWVSLTDNLTPTHTLYIESRSIEMAKRAQRYKVSNGNVGQKIKIPVQLQADCEEILEIGGLLMTTLGHNVFEPLLHESEKENSLRFYCRRNGAQGEGIYTSEGFVVLKGSRGKFTHTGKVSDHIIAGRDALVEEEIIQIDGDSSIFLKDHLFKSPSAAATAILTSSANGWTEWRTADGRTLSDIYRTNTELG